MKCCLRTCIQEQWFWSAWPFYFVQEVKLTGNYVTQWLERLETWTQPWCMMPTDGAWGLRDDDANYCQVTMTIDLLLITHQWFMTLMECSVSSGDVHWAGFVNSWEMLFTTSYMLTVPTFVINCTKWAIRMGKDWLQASQSNWEMTHNVPNSLEDAFLIWWIYKMNFVH